MLHLEVLLLNLFWNLIVVFLLSDDLSRMIICLRFSTTKKYLKLARWMIILPSSPCPPPLFCTIRAELIDNEDLTLKLFDDRLKQYEPVDDNRSDVTPNTHLILGINSWS